MASGTSKCILHKDRTDATEELISITEKTWIKIIECEKIRRDHHKKSSWLDIIHQLSCEQPTNGAFHMRCYKSFTSIPKAQLVKSSEAPINTSCSPTHTLRHDSESVTKSNSGVLKKICMFCKNPYKRTSSREFQRVTAVMAYSVEKEIKKMIRNDEKMWIENGEVDFVAKEVPYHIKCKHNYSPPLDNLPSRSIDYV